MKKTYYLLMVFLLPLVSAVTISPGVLFNTTNTTWVVNNTLTLDNLTVGSDWVMFNNDNISIVPNSSLNISVNRWQSSTSHQFVFLPTSNTGVDYTITVDGNNAFVYYDDDYHVSPLNINALTIWTYYRTTDATFYFRDEDDLKLVNFENVSIDFINDAYGENYTTSTGNLTVELPRAVFIVRYSSPSYQERFYYLDFTGGATSPITLYMINKTQYSNITITVIDQLGQGVEGSQVKALKYYVATNQYLLQEVGTTDISGKTYMSLTKNDEYYKFQVQYEGVTLKTTNPAYIRTDEITIPVIIGSSIGDEYDRFNSLDYNLTFNPLTDNFRLTFNNVDGVVGKICLYTYRLTTMSKNRINSSCSTVASGTILSPITPINNSYYRSEAYYTNPVSGLSVYLDAIEHEYYASSNIGYLGLILQIIITLAIVMVGYWSIPIAAILAPLSLIVGRLIGLNSLGYDALIPLFIVGLAVAFFMRKS